MATEATLLRWLGELEPDDPHDPNCSRADEEAHDLGIDAAGIGIAESELPKACLKNSWFWAGYAGQMAIIKRYEK